MNTSFYKIYAKVCFLFNSPVLNHCQKDMYFGPVFARGLFTDHCNINPLRIGKGDKSIYKYLSSQ